MSGQCQCRLCTAVVFTESQVQYRSRVRRTHDNGGVAPILTHNAYTYANWHCRCDECVAAKSILNAQNREGRRASDARRRARLRAERETAAKVAEAKAVLARYEPEAVA